jgi:hypothetical protein
MPSKSSYIWFSMVIHRKLFKFEVDGITPKRKSGRWSYEKKKGKLLREMKPTCVGAHMILTPEAEFAPIRTTTVQAVSIR